jgi:hypothetical protein
VSRVQSIGNGRVLIDQLEAWAVPQTLRAHRETLRRLGEVYKQLNAPFGQFGIDALALSTRAVKSGTSSDDSLYTTLSGQLAGFTARRDALADPMRALLDAAAFAGDALNEGDAKQLIGDAEQLLGEVHSAAQP